MSVSIYIMAVLDTVHGDLFPQPHRTFFILPLWYFRPPLSVCLPKQNMR